LRPDTFESSAASFREMVERVHVHEWRNTSLGPAETWPSSLRGMVRLLLSSKFPMFVLWGDERTLVYNDAYVPILGDKHPWALGQSFSNVWPEVQDEIGPIINRAFSGEASFFEDLPVVLRRGSRPEQTYFTFSYSPVSDDDGVVGGVFCVCTETTHKVLAERGAAAERERFQRMFEEAPGFICVLRGPAHVFEMVNRACRHLLGPSREYLGKSVAEAVPELRDQGFEEILDEVFETGKPFVATGMTAVFRRSPDQPADERILDFVYQPIFEHDGSVSGIFCEGIDVTERVASDAALRESEDHHRHAVELNPQVAWTAASDGQLDHVAQRWMEWTGTTGLGSTWAEGLHPDDRSRTFEVWGNSVVSGEPYDIEHRVKMRNGEYRWARSRAYPRRDDAGRIVKWYGTTEDIHERKVAEERQALLVNELNHRVKNTLATVQSIAMQTLRNLPDPSARDRLSTRLVALSRAHDVLTREGWEGADLRLIVETVVAPYRGVVSRFSVAGPYIRLAPTVSLTLAMALNELCTNAAKYGALSAEGGRIEIDWKVADERLQLRWEEKGGPAVEPPAERGFGSRLVERQLAHELNGMVQLQFLPSGVVCEIEAPLNAVVPIERES
jgi:PAS domain S-box-containing protein